MLVSLLFVLFPIISGCLFDSDGKDNVKKGSVSGKVTMVVTDEPLAGARVMLVNMKAKIDSADFTGNSTAFVDSALTGADGSYFIDGIRPGYYGIIPVGLATDPGAIYTFFPSGSGENCLFVMNGESRTVDFNAERVDYPGAGTITFTITVSILCDKTKYQLTELVTSRRKWILFIPFYDYHVVTTIANTPIDIFNHTMTNDLGFTAVFAAIDNYFHYDVKFRDNASGSLLNRTFDIGFPLSDTPASSEWKYEIETGILTRIP